MGGPLGDQEQLTVEVTLGALSCFVLFKKGIINGS